MIVLCDLCVIAGAWIVFVRKKEDSPMPQNFVVRLTVESLVLCITLIFGLSAANADTIAHFDTSVGSFDVQLYDTAAPITVQNFLAYVSNGLYQDSFVHRSIPGFVIQGGGFTYDQPNVYAVPAFDPIINEFDPSRSNVRGTIAMAKVAAQYDDQGNLIPGTGPDSATSQWFFNLGDNSYNLDNQNGGFTVFGEVLGDGMDVVDAIAALDIFNFGGVFSDLPLRNYTSDDYYNYVPVTDNNIMFVNVYLPGDANGDNKVDDSDLNLLLTGWGIGTDWQEGDFNADDIVNDSDLNFLLSNWTYPPASSAVPEPATLGLLTVGGLVMVRRRRRK